MSQLQVNSTTAIRQYFAKANGKLAKDEFVKFNKKQYYAGKNCVIVKGSHVSSDKYTYYCDEITGELTQRTKCK